MGAPVPKLLERFFKSGTNLGIHCKFHFCIIKLNSTNIEISVPKVLVQTNSSGTFTVNRFKLELPLKNRSRLELFQLQVEYIGTEKHDPSLGGPGWASEFLPLSQQLPSSAMKQQPKPTQQAHVFGIPDRFLSFNPFQLEPGIPVPSVLDPL